MNIDLSLDRSIDVLRWCYTTKFEIEKILFLRSSCRRRPDCYHIHFRTDVVALYRISATRSDLCYARPEFLLII